MEATLPNHQVRSPISSPTRFKLTTPPAIKPAADIYAVQTLLRSPPEHPCYQIPARTSKAGHRSRLTAASAPPSRVIDDTLASERPRPLPSASTHLAPTPHLRAPGHRLPDVRNRLFAFVGFPPSTHHHLLDDPRRNAPPARHRLSEPRRSAGFTASRRRQGKAGVSGVSFLSGV